MRKRLRRKGFTLIELLVAIAVLGILAAAVAPRYFGMLTSVRQGVDKLSCKTIYRTIIMFNESGDKAAIAGEPTLEELVEKGYISTPRPQSGSEAFKIIYNEDKITISGGVVSVDFEKP